MKPLESSQMNSQLGDAELKDYDNCRLESQTSAVIDYYKHKNLKFNVALMGDRSSGKTSFLRQIL